MQQEEGIQPSETYKIVCSHYPEIFDLDKSICKNYFRQYGKVMRLIFKPKQHVIVVEYTNKNDYLNALAGTSEYDGQPFKLETFEPGIPPAPRPKGDSTGAKKKSRDKLVKRHKLTYFNPQEMVMPIKRPQVSYIDNDEVNAELAAMSTYSNSKDIINLTPEPLSMQARQRRAPKLNRVWKKEDAVMKKPPAEKPKKVMTVKKKLIQTMAKQKVKEKIKMLTADQLELLKVIRLQANTVEEKYKVLDARDKLLKSNMKKSLLKSNPTVGTCPDMCPEKERLLREIQHQVSIYEQDPIGRHVMDHNKAVKQYSRSSADQEAPLPHELRPVSVLQLAMIYLMYNIMDLSENDADINLGEWFHFLWDRTRGVRKDITQQALCCQRSVELVEQCARFHIHCSARLMGEDPSVFDQKINTENLTKCLQTLKYMYHDLELKGEKCTHEAEFRAYIILLNLNDGNFMWEVQELRRDIQKSPEVKFALQIYSAFEKRNYVKFFKLIKSTTYLNTCILMRYFIQVRVQAIETLIKCFTPPKSISFYPVQELTSSLFFDDAEATVDFMKTYGMGLNKDDTSFLIERSSFSMPEYPYVLERSSCVERKKLSSVGAIVNGEELSPEKYMQMQSHEVHNSFDKDGYLVQDEMFNKIELSIEERLLEDEPDSRESTPERSNMVTNIFASKTQANASLKKTSSPNTFGVNEDRSIFTHSKPDVFGPSKGEAGNIFTQTKPEFGQHKTEPSNIFTQLKSEPMQVQQDSNIFAAAATKRIVPGVPNSKDELDASKLRENVFAPGFSEVKEPPNIFARSSEKIDHFGKLDNDDSEKLSSRSNIFAIRKDPRTQPQTTVFGAPTTTTTSKSQINIFAAEEPPKPPKKGGFTFVLNRPQRTTEVPNIFATGFKPISGTEHQKQREHEQYEAELNVLEQERNRLQEEIRKETEKEEQIKREQEELQKRNEEIRQKNEEAAERRRLEAERLKREEIERKKREEQERIERDRRLERERIEREKRLERERKRLEEEMRLKQAELERQRKEQEEKQRNKEIHKTVKFIVTKMVETVDIQIRQETLSRIRESMKRRFLLGVCEKWRSIAIKRMKKRKALDCNPTFVHTKSVTQCATDLRSKSQDLALSHMKRYKYGKPLDVPLLEKRPVGQLRLFHLTYSSLRRRLCELEEKWHQHIYWKVVVSIPDIDEMITGLHKLEGTLNAFINWNLDKYGNTAYIEQHKTVTYCVEKQQGMEVKCSDASAFVFIAKSFNDLMQRRIFENLKDFGVCVKLPVVLILEDTANSESYLRNLRDTGIVSDYAVYSCNLASQVLPSIIDNGLIFLSKRVEKYPPLEMDTFYSFITKHLCSEIWKKAGSYAKWNHEYNFCMRDPNVVIGLYNEGLKLLSKIITDKKCREYAIFPEIFRNYLPDKVPDFLPCDYRYFPSFWATRTYEEHLKSILENLKLPKFLEKWPPNNEEELLLSVSKYCEEVFDNPQTLVAAITGILKESGDDDNFDKTLWTGAIQVVAEAKLKQQNLKLPKQIFSDVITTFVVVYDVDMLSEYCSTEWFYRNNPLIESYKKIISNKLEEEQEEEMSRTKQSRNRKRALDISLDHDDVFSVIKKAENILRSPKSMSLETKDQIKYLNRSLKDLEDSINVVKRMDEMNLLKRFIES